MKLPFLKSKYVRNISVVMSGTVISQGVIVAATPLLTRLYDPTAFGVFSVFISISVSLATIASGKYDLAVILPKKNKDAVNLFYLSILIIILNVSLISIIIFLFNSQIISLFEEPGLENYIWGIPILVLGIGLYTLFNSWNTRRQQYKRLSISRVSRSVSQVTIQSVVSKALTSGGLIVGQIIGQLIATITLSRFIIKKDKNLFAKPDFRLIRNQIKEYKEFPLYNAPQHFVNAITTNSAIFLLAFFFGSGIVGLYAVSVKVLQMPISLISESLGKVFYQRAAGLHNNGKSVYNLLKKSTVSLGCIFVIPWIIFIIIAPQTFGFLLGEEWYEAGEFAQWIGIWMFFVALNAPSVKIFIIYRLQKIHLYLNVIFSVIRISALLIGGYYFTSLITIQLFVIASIFSNLALIFIAFYFSKRYEKRF